MTCHRYAQQDEFKFFMDDAKSKLLLVPTEGNSTAERAATDLHIPIATLALTSSGGTLTSIPCTDQRRCGPVATCRFAAQPQLLWYIIPVV